ncbi:hypothetical protein BET03_05910 [Thermohalobacter berrensis]|uniref:G5 domain-containing protein n=1 Tax=Thermohalobacter berrensis TaxID=99594 RepID=A0A419SVB1_9FIRM|nr:hypothetical protein BET03_05910 [Thermohalobacter berrensis]
MIILSALLLILVISVGIFMFIVLNKTTIHKGVKINTVPVEGLSRSEAVEYLKEKLDEDLEKRVLKLKYQNTTYSFSYDKIGVSYDYYTAVDKAYKLGREGNLIKRIGEIIRIGVKGYEMYMDYKVQEDKLDRVVNIIARDLDLETKNAKIFYQNGKLTIIPEVRGRRVNKALLKEKIVNNLLNTGYVSIPVEYEKPSITEKMLKKINGPLGSFTTYYSGSSQGRIHNIKLAARSINGKVILPGKIFSFNKTTGPRDAEAGYKKAKVVIDGDLTDGVGGGVCQVSTTLYNAVLLSDLEVVERHPHSIPSAYVSKGRDATVAYNYLDLKFKNNTEFPIYIHTEAINNKISISIFGNTEDKSNNIKIKSIITETINPKIKKIVDDSLKPGETLTVQKGRYGYRVKTYKVILKNGKEVNRELVSTDYYKPRNKIIKVGPQLKENVENNGLLNLLQ